MKESKFNFYENVKVFSNDPNLKIINGKDAVVLGKTLTDEGEWYYAIGVKNDYGWCAMEQDLISLGSFSKKEDIYSGDSVKVYVNEVGEGNSKE